MTAPSQYFSRRLGRLSIALAVVGATIIVVLGWWAADRIDSTALQRQTQFISLGIIEIEERTALEQDGSAIWDEAVENVRTNNGEWLAENAVEWVSSFFSHDRVYILDPQDRPMRGASQGELLDPDAYLRDKAAVEPIVAELRAQMAKASTGMADSTAAITGLGVLDRRVVAGGEVGIVSARPIVPSSGKVTQAPGSEYLHVSIRLLDADLSATIAEHYSIEALSFESSAPPSAGLASAPLLDRSGRILGFFTWRAYRPAQQLLLDTAPGIGAAGIAGALIVLLLVRSLGRTSAKLERSEAHARYLAFHDSLTKIPNRALFEDRLERALASRRLNGRRLALHFIDLDRFKHVNDSLGHAAGDELVRLAAERLGTLVSEVDTVARIGGDEFAIIQVDTTSVEQVLNLAGRIVAAIAEPFDVSGHEALIGASVGIALAEEPDLAPEDLMRRADVALYEAKAEGRGRYHVFGGDLDLAVRERRALEVDLRAAINDGTGLELVYQPIFRAGGSKVAGVEALVRWNNPTRGRLSPAMFIGLAEERGLIDQLGMWVLREACRFARSSPDLPWVAVNVSPLQFRDERFVERVMAVLSETELSPYRLEIEITEGLLLQNSPKVQETLRLLRATGIRVALDDFGTGYSSISYLRTYGVDKLKIDQSYVAKLGRDLQIDHIVRCIIDLARAMHMQVTAEGVETEEQKEILVGMHCDQLQGYLLSRPLTAEATAQLMASKTLSRERMAS